MNLKANHPCITDHKREYERIYSGKDARFWELLDSPWYSFVRSHLPALKGRNVLEIACGFGALSCYMSKSGAEVCAVDIAEEALRRGERYARERELNVRFVCGNIYDIPFPDNFFDVVVSCETIEHLEFPSLGMREIVRVTKPGGRLYLTTENYLNLLGLYRLSLWLRGREFNSGGGVQPVEQPFTYFSLLSLLKSVGARIILSEGSTHQVWIPKMGLHNLEFIDRVPAISRQLKYFGRHVGFVATIGK